MASRGTVSIVGVPFSGGQPRGGVDLGPKYLRDAGLHDAIRAQNWDVRDTGDVALPPQTDDDVLGIAKKPRYVGGTCENLRDAVLAEIKTDNFVLVVGGDHSIAAGSISAVLENDPETCIVWIDAHSDINTIDTTHTGNIHGMPVSFLMNLTNMRSLPGFEWMANSPVLRPDRIAYIGLRDVDEGEKVILREKNILAFSMNDVDRLGIVKVMENVMQHLNADGSRRIHLSLDVDGIDTLHTPATGTPVPGGLSLREGRYICETLFQTGQLKSMDVVEINPQLSDQQGIESTLNSSLLLIKTALGRSLLKN